MIVENKTFNISWKTHVDGFLKDFDMLLCIKTHHKVLDLFAVISLLVSKHCCFTCHVVSLLIGR